jgi:hypothetical protein
VQQAGGLGNHQARCRHAHERHGNRLAGQLESAAFVLPEAGIAWILASDTRLTLGALPALLRARIRPPIPDAYLSTVLQRLPSVLTDGYRLQFRVGASIISEEVSRELRRQGTVIVFPSTVLHRVSPVERGVRYSLVAWYLG